MTYSHLGLIAMLALLLRPVAAGAAAGFDANQFQNIQREPDVVSVVTESGAFDLRPETKGLWSASNVKVKFRSQGNGLAVTLSAPDAAMKSLQIRWQANLAPDWNYLGDAWERAYGDLEWKPLDAKRVLPWYFLASDGALTHGYGVKTGPSALIHWTADEHGLTLHADVRCGGAGVQLGRRELDVCTIVSRCGRSKETPFAAARAFCEMMCPHPRLPKLPVYGFNDWYCTYGHDTADNFLANVTNLVALGPQGGNRPYAVVDDGWQWKGQRGESPGLWNRTDPHFDKILTMPEFAAKVSALGAKPGLWYRPLIASAEHPREWRLQRDASILDPTVPEVRALIRAAMARFHGWGFQLVKHDYTTFDLCGRWGMQMNGQMTPDGWAFADHSRTTAEVMRDLYHDIREAAGDHTVIIGCNTVGHLAAGVFEMQRIGDDTSGREWKRTRDMGVNCLAFRAPQQGTFFAVDADCAGQVASDSVPWEKNSQWLSLLAHSGTPLFVSFPYETLNADQTTALRAALQAASRPQPVAEPLDWQTRHTPEHWRMDGRETKFDW